MKFLKRSLVVALAAIVTTLIFVSGWWNFGDWKTRAIEDIAFIHATVKDHHPGPVDQENPEFAAVMELALKNGESAAQFADSSDGHKAALDAYFDTFHDGHFTAFHVNDGFQLVSNWLSPESDEPRRSIGIERNGSAYWITIPSFSEASNDIRTLTEKIEAQSSELQAAEEIVFDLRGNGGGDSSFATRIAVALWSEKTYLDWVPPSAAAVEWRASVENADHVLQIAQKNRDAGDEERAQSWQGTADGIRTKALAGEPFYKQQISMRKVTRSVDSPVKGRVIVLTDANCASACLDFMDKLVALPGTIHLGQETSADTQYIDVRRLTLPSNAGLLILPLKVYRERFRPSGGTYVPSVEIDPKSASWATVREAAAAFSPQT